MGSDKFHEDLMGVEQECRYQSIIVASDIEYDAVIADDASGGVMCSYFIRGFPSGRLDFENPRKERAFGIRIFDPEMD